MGVHTSRGRRTASIVVAALVLGMIIGTGRALAFRPTIDVLIGQEGAYSFRPGAVPGGIVPPADGRIGAYGLDLSAPPLSVAIMTRDRREVVGAVTDVVVEDSESLYFTLAVSLPEGGYIARVEAGGRTAEATFYVEPGPVARLAGADRYDTAALINHVSRPYLMSSAVVVASGENFPDALVAGSLGETLLLTGRDFVPGTTAAELARLQPTYVLVVGGTSVISPAVEEQLARYASPPDLPGDTGTHLKTLRIAGNNRYATAVEVAKRAAILEPGCRLDRVVIASGRNYPDALAAGSLNGYDILLLTEPDGLPPETAEALGWCDDIAEIVVAGGSAAVSDGVLAELRAYGDTVVRVAGPDRYATAVALLEHGRDDVSLESDGVLLATGTTFPDALAASTASATWGAPVLLVETNRLPTVVRETLERAQPWWITILGGPNAVSPAVEAQLHDLVGTPEWVEYGE